MGLARYAVPNVVGLLRLPVNTYDLHRRIGGRQGLIRAIYEELVKREIRYNVEPQGALPNRQAIRTPYEILQTPGQGTCLDLALLFCGLCLGHNLIPILVVLEGHALAMVSLGRGLPELEDYGRTESSLFSEGLLAGEVGQRELLQLIQRDEYLIVECTGFAHTETLSDACPEGIGRLEGYLPFDRAIEAGRASLTASERPFRYALDVATLHRLGITPFEILPQAVELAHKTTVDSSLLVSPVPHELPRTRVAFETITILESQLRGKIDESGKALADEIGKAFSLHNFSLAISSRTKLLDWLSGEGQSASRQVRGSLFALLADTVVLEAGLGGEAGHADFSAALDFYSQALRAYGAEISDEDEARLTALKAKIKYLSDERESALSLVDKRIDPPCLSLRLSILIDQERFAEAADAVDGVTPHEKWVDRAITARVVTGDRAGADELLAWTKGREGLDCFRRSLVAYSQALVISTLGGPKVADTKRFHTISDRQKESLADALVTLQPLLRAGDDIGRLGSGLEAAAHALALQVGGLIRNGDRCRRSADLLASVTPVPLELGNAAIRGEVQTPHDLPARLRRDYPKSLEVQMLAAMVEARRLDRVGDAFSALATVAELARTDGQKLKLAQCLFELSTAGSVSRTGEVLFLVRKLLGEGHPFEQLVQAFGMIEAGDTNSAGRILAGHEAPADPLWLQLAAKKKVREGDKAGAMEDLIAAGAVLGSAELLLAGAGMANSIGKTDREIFALQKALDLNPSDTNARTALAMHLLHSQEYAQAAAQFSRLREVGVADKEIVFNHAVALCNAGRAGDGLAAYRELVARHPDWLPGVSACAQILHALGQTDEAFRLIHTARDRFWSMPAFVAQYVDIGHGVGREQEAAEGLRRLFELEQPDQGTSSILKTLTVEQWKEMERERFENRKDIDEKILRGQVPWLLAGNVLGRIPSRDWSYRTQLLNVGDHPLARAEFSIYATNGFRVGYVDESHNKHLVQTECPPPGTAVVADLSALITLDRIGALDDALAYFGKVFIPASYRPELLHEQCLLRPIQPARLRGLRAIRDAVDQGRLLVLIRGAAVERRLTTLHEYHDPEDPQGFGALDVATELLRVGLIETGQFDALRHAARRTPSAKPPDVLRAFESGGLLSDEFTLALLREHDALDPLLDVAQVYIDEAEMERIRNDLRVAEFDGEILGWHQALRQRLDSDPRFESVPVPTRGQENIAEDQQEAAGLHGDTALGRYSLPLHAFQIAQARSIPLLVDDRVLQAVLSNASRSSNHAAFGTGDVLSALVEAGGIDIDRAAQFFLSLVRLRYRFLLPPTEFLVALARRFRSHPPGEQLREVARYVHDCMRDPGLHGGMEPTEPPVSMAVHLWHQWAMAVAKFLVAVWHDDDFEDDAAAVLTRWAIQECLPSVPRNCPPTVAGHLSQTLPMTVVSGALVHIDGPLKPARTNRALEEIARALSLSDGAYTQIVADILLSLVGLAHDNETVPDELLRSFATTALRHLTEVEPSTHYALYRLGLIEPAAQEDDLSAAQISEIADRSGQAKLGCPEGPLAFVKGAEDGAPRVMVPVPVLIFDENPVVRSAAVSFLNSLSAGPPVVVSAHGQATIRACSHALVASERDVWFPAACRLSQVLEQDYLLHLAGFRQKLWAGSWDSEGHYWPKVVRPGRSLAISVQATECDPTATPEEASAAIGRIAQDSGTLGEALDLYLEGFGHLPLAPPFSAGSLVGRWLEQRGQIQGFWDEIWAWAGRRFDPVRRYHVCRIFLEHPSLVPDDKKCRFWDEFAGMLKASQIVATEEPCGRSWKLRADIARLYLLQLESHVPGHDVDQLARLAWWAACRLGNAIENPGRGRIATDDFLDQVHEKLIEPTYGKERILSLGGVSGSGLSPLSYATMYGGCPWALSLLSALGPSSSVLDPGVATDDAREAIFHSLVTHLVLGFPLASEEGNPWPFAFGATLGQAAMFWHGVETDEEKRNAIASLLKEHVRIASREHILETLRNLPACEEGERRMLQNGLAGLARCGDLPANEILRVASDPAWFRRAMTELPDQGVWLLVDTLVTIECRFGGDWGATLPHLIAGVVELEGVSRDRKEFLVQGVILACVGGGTASALRRLSLGTRPSRHANILRCFRARLESYMPFGSPWVTARLRDILSSLPAATAAPAMLPNPHSE